MLVIEDLGNILEVNGIGVQGENIFLGIERDTPESQVVVIPTGGYMLSSQLNDAKPTFQIYVRDISYSVGYEKINNIFKLFTGNTQIISPSGRKMIIKPMQPPFSLGLDENNHSMFVFNVTVITSIS